MTPLATYKLYVAFKAHFENPDYDILKYKAKTSATKKSFEEHSHRVLFERLSKQPDVPGLLLANFCARPIAFVGDIFDDAGQATFTDWQARNEALEYRFKEDLNRLPDPFYKNFRLTEGEVYPMALRLHNQGKIGLETLIILDCFLGLFKRWEKQIDDQIVFPEQVKRFRKYRPFVEFDETKYKQLILARWQESLDNGPRFK